MGQCASRHRADPRLADLLKAVHELRTQVCPVLGCSLMVVFGVLFFFFFFFLFFFLVSTFLA